MRRSLLFLALVVLAGCTDVRPRAVPTGPAAVPGQPSLDILDGTRGGGSGFHWLPPMVTSLPTPTGVFDNTPLAAMEVEVCELGAVTCMAGGLRRVFTSTTGSLLDRVRLFPNQQYQVLYASAADNLDPAKHYRASVFVYGVRLGYADIDVVASLTELGAVDRTRYAALTRGQNLPIAFRLDDVFPSSCSAASIDALTTQVFGDGAASAAFRGAIRRLAYLHRFGSLSETETALQAMADDLNARAGDAIGNPVLFGLIAQLRVSLYCVVGRTVPPPIEGTVTGTVTGTNGRGSLQGVTVRIDPAGLTGTTDGTGRYTITSVPAGPITIAIISGLPVGCIVPAAQHATAGLVSVTADFEASCTSGGVSITPASLVAGVEHTCGLTTDGAAYCWGNSGLPMGSGSLNGSAVPVAVSGGLSFRTLSAGSRHTCGVTPAGIAYCWGNNSFGELGDGTQMQRLAPVVVSGGLTFATIAAGDTHTCGITRAGAAYCWGNNANGRLGDGSLVTRRTPVAVWGEHNFISLAVSRRNVTGQGHNCGVTAEGEVYCWGNNGSRQLGSTTPAQSSQPLKVPSSQVFTSVVAGTLHTCALTSDGKAYCWGYASSFGKTLSTGIPTESGEGRTFASLTAGVYHTCGLTPEGAAYCFGVNGQGELGDGTSGANGLPRAPSAVSGGHAFRTLAAGGYFTCGLTEGGAALCWGASNGGELGDGSTGRRRTPVPVLGGLSFRTLTAGGEHTCGVASTGATHCWGDNQSSQLGDGTTLRRHAPWLVSGGVPFERVFASRSLVGGGGRGHGCGLTVGGETYCWGSNSNLQLGILGETRSVPTRVPGVPTLSQLALGGTHTCGLTVDGQAYCWGSNSLRELGRGTSTSTAQLPGMNSGSLQLTSLAAGSHHTCGLTTSGAAYCWGYNNRGQVGDGTSGVNRSDPVAVSGGLSFVALAAGGEHTCGITVGGATYCWGYNSFGQIGNATVGPVSAFLTPVVVGGGRSFVALTAGTNHNCGLTSTGSAFCWGWNQSGQLGDGTSVSSSAAPVAVAGGFQFVELHAGQHHTCGVTISGAAHCWGSVGKGQLGDEYIRHVAGGLVFRLP